jgi:hypothetical protein
MPDAKCDKCGLQLGPICKSPVEIKRFTDLVNARCTKLPIVNQIVSISPGIHHNEIDTESECDGVMWYQALAPTPGNVSWGS